MVSSAISTPVKMCAMAPLADMFNHAVGVGSTTTTIITATITATTTATTATTCPSLTHQGPQVRWGVKQDSGQGSAPPPYLDHQEFHDGTQATGHGHDHDHVHDSGDTVHRHRHRHYLAHLRLTFTAARAIRPGEEISISYGNSKPAGSDKYAQVTLVAEAAATLCLF
jgi:hypothetical protein